MIPDDVIVQVLTQARPKSIERTFELLRGYGARSCICTIPHRPCNGAGTSVSTGSAYVDIAVKAARYVRGLQGGQHHLGAYAHQDLPFEKL